jgi:hypothetical protein
LFRRLLASLGVFSLIQRGVKAAILVNRLYQRFSIEGLQALHRRFSSSSPGLVE